MQRSLYPEGVEVHHRHLAFTETTKAEEILQRHLDHAVPGVVSGLAVTVSNVGAVKNLIDVSAGYGYAQGGELVELETAAVGVALADLTAGAQNYVVLVYSETMEQMEAHEYEEGLRPTKAVRSSRLRVFTEAQWASIPLTDEDMQQDAKDRSILLAIVTARGAGAALSSADIVSTTKFPSVLSVYASGSIDGISIQAVAAGTQQGVGTLAWSPVDSTISWTAPGGATGSVAVSGDGQYTINAGGSSVTVSVTSGSLPASTKSISLSIRDMYAQVAPRATAVDAHHRSMLGTGVPTPNNPHGLSIADLGGDLDEAIVKHQDLMHANGMLRGSSAGALALSVNKEQAVHRLFVADLAPGDRLWVNGREVSALANPGYIAFADGPVEQTLYGIYVDQGGVVSKVPRVTFGSSTHLIHRFAQLFDISDGISSDVLLEYHRNDPLNTGDTTKRAFTLNIDGVRGNPAYLTAQRQMLRVWAPNSVDYVDLYVETQAVFDASVGTPDSATLSITPMPDHDSFVHIGYVCWSGSGDGDLGVGFDPDHSPNALVQRRSEGTLAVEHLTDGARYELQEAPFGETHAPGVVWSNGPLRADAGFAVSNISGNEVTVLGGVCYLRGKRTVVEPGTLTLTYNATNFVFVSADGVLDVSQTAPTAHDGVLVHAFKTDGSGNVTNAYDLRRWMNDGDVAVGVVVGPKLAGTNGAPACGHFTTLAGACEYVAATASVFGADAKPTIWLRGGTIESGGATVPTGVALVGTGARATTVSGSVVMSTGSSARGITFTGNVSTVNSAADVSLTACRFTPSSGAGLTLGIASQPRITECTFSGGSYGVYSTSTVTGLVVSRSSFATHSTAAISIAALTSSKVLGNTFSNTPIAVHCGGTLENTTVADNLATNCAALLSAPSAPTAIGISVTGNTVRSAGSHSHPDGCIYIRGSIALWAVNVSDNMIADPDDIAIHLSSDADMHELTIRGNSISSSGGAYAGIVIDGDSAVLRNSIISGNSIRGLAAVPNEDDEFIDAQCMGISIGLMNAAPSSSIACSGVTISDNSIVNCATSGSLGVGQWVRAIYAIVDSASITGNSVVSFGQMASDGAGYGIYVDALNANSSCVISSNHLDSVKYPIWAVSSCTVADNDIDNSTMGITVYGSGARFAVSGNAIRRCLHGISVNGAGGSVSGNRVHCGVDSPDTMYGITATWTAATPLSISGNTISALAGDFSNFGVRVIISDPSASSSLSICNNSLSDIGRAGALSYSFYIDYSGSWANDTPISVSVSGNSSVTMGAMLYSHTNGVHNTALSITGNTHRSARGTEASSTQSAVYVYGHGHVAMSGNNIVHKCQSTIPIVHMDSGTVAVCGNFVHAENKRTADGLLINVGNSVGPITGNYMSGQNSITDIGITSAMTPPWTRNGYLVYRTIDMTDSNVTYDRWNGTTNISTTTSATIPVVVESNYMVG